MLHDLVAASAAVSATRSRLAKTEHLAGLLERTRPEEIRIAIAYLSGQLPQGKIGIGYAVLRDLGTIPAAKSPSLGLSEVDATFAAIASESGQGSSRRRVGLLRELLARATADEQSFLRRLVVGQLRQGALEGSMADALASTTRLPARAVRRAIMLAGDIGEVASAVIDEGARGLDRFAIQVMRPLSPMLAQPADDIARAVERLGEAALEYKLDGARVQAHKSGDEVRVFTRQLREVTPAVPEIVEAVRDLPAREVILDGEVLALRPDGRPQPFQVTMKRFGRRLDVERAREEVPLTPFWFDVLLLDGSAVMDETQAVRSSELARLVPPDACVPRLTTGDSDTASAFLDRALSSGHEGIVAKALDAAYEAGSRGAGWIKVKPARTLDLVVLAAEWGSGRRKGWLSNLHLGARDVEHGGFVMLGKTFKGLSDALLTWQTKALLERELSRDEWTVHVRPELVVEIAFNDLQASRRYPGGLALRFARVKRYRDDKGPADADTIATVREIYLRSIGADSEAEG